jgi:plastocyanin
MTPSVGRRFVLSTLVAVGLSLAGLAPAADATGEITGTVDASVAKNRANTIVYVKNAPHPAGNAKAVMDQKGLVFVPRVLPIHQGTTVEFKNSDPTGHNVFTPDNEKYDLGTWPAGQVRKYTFSKTGVYRQLCRVHDDMIAYIVVLDTRFFALSDKAGKFRIGGLPAGKYTVGVWHEKLVAADASVDVAAGKPTELNVTLRAKP